MKIRPDFVSNSSSCSFIIRFDDNGKSFDSNFFKILKLSAETINLKVSYQSENELASLVKSTTEAFKNAVKVDKGFDDNEVDFNFKASKIDADDKCQVSVFRKLLKNCTSFYVSCGEDFGSDLVDAVKTAVLLESKYKAVSIDGDDHFDYTSIRGTDIDD